MGFLSKLRHQDDSPDQTCPRCHLPVAADATECPECGWDLREAYHPTDPVSNADPA
jgi:hypothetical protein